MLGLSRPTNIEQRQSQLDLVPQCQMNTNKSPFLSSITFAGYLASLFLDASPETHLRSTMMEWRWASSLRFAADSSTHESDPLPDCPTHNCSVQALMIHNYYLHYYRQEQFTIEVADIKTPLGCGSKYPISLRGLPGDISQSAAAPSEPRNNMRFSHHRSDRLSWCSYPPL